MIFFSTLIDVLKDFRQFPESGFQILQKSKFIFFKIFSAQQESTGKSPPAIKLQLVIAIKKDVL